MKRFTVICGGSPEEREHLIQKRIIDCPKVREILINGNGSRFGINPDDRLIIIRKMRPDMLPSFIKDILSIENLTTNFIIDFKERIPMEPCIHVDIFDLGEKPFNFSAPKAAFENETQKALDKYQNIDKVNEVCDLVRKHDLDFFQGCAIYAILEGDLNAARKMLKAGQ